MERPSRAWLRRGGAIAAVALGYMALGALGMAIAFERVTMVWAPSGLALAVLILHGRWLLPGVWLGSFLVNALYGGPDVAPERLAGSAGVATGATAEALIASALIARHDGARS